MRGKLIIGLGLALLTAVPAAAELPFGVVDGAVTGQNAVTGVVGVAGWALDDSGVVAVDVYVDGVIVGRANYGRHRPGVAQGWPSYPDSEAAGFGFQLDTTQFLNGLHVVSVRVRALDGDTAWIDEIVLEFTNTSSLLKPFGVIQFPNEHAELRGECNLDDPFRRYVVVDGWVLDAGVELGSQSDPPGDAGVAYVELLIDGAFWANSKVDCAHDPDRGGLSNCYGLPSRNGIEHNFAGLPDAQHARFRFVLDVGWLLNVGYVPGSHVITIRSGDFYGNVADVDEIVVTFTCDHFLANENSFGHLRTPPGGLMHSGMVDIRGWALDWEGVSRVEIWVDGNKFGDATYGASRPAVRSRYPGYPDSLGPGFSFMLDSTLLSDGEHDVAALVIDLTGKKTLLGEITITVNNDAP